MNIESQIELFIAHTQRNIAKHYELNYTNVKAPTLAAEYGQEYCRIVTINGSQKSVFCFIALRDGKNKAGDILKSASYKAPAKGARGNIFESLERGVTVYGAEYFR